MVSLLDRFPSWTEFTLITAGRLTLYPSSGMDPYPWPLEEGGMLIPHFPGEDQRLQRREYLTSHTCPRLKSREPLGSSAVPTSTGCLPISVGAPPTHGGRVNKMSLDSSGACCLVGCCYCGQQEDLVYLFVSLLVR